MTTKQAAERLGLTVSGVMRLIERKQLSAEKFGHSWAIAPDSLANVVQKRLIDAERGLKKRGRKRTK